MYDKKKNTGLSYRFTVDANGRIPLTGGPEKVAENLFFTMTFIGWFRIYYSDFVPDLLSLVQKPTNLLQIKKVLILGKFQKLLTKYVPQLRVLALNTIYNYNDRKGFGIVLRYTHSLEPEAEKQLVKFIQV